MLHNPHRNFNKGMEDAYMGNEPQMTYNRQYMIGYEYSMQLLDEIQEDQQDEEPEPKQINSKHYNQK